MRVEPGGTHSTEQHARAQQAVNNTCFLCPLSGLSLASFSQTVLTSLPTELLWPVSEVSHRGLDKAREQCACWGPSRAVSMVIITL